MAQAAFEAKLRLARGVVRSSNKAVDEFPRSECLTPDETARIMVTPAEVVHKAVVDLGCGTGALLKHLKAAAFGSLTGVDIDLRLQGSWNMPGVFLIQEDYTEWTFVSRHLNRFDVVISNPEFKIKFETLAVISCIMKRDGFARVILPSATFSRPKAKQFLYFLGLEYKIVEDIGNPTYFGKQRKRWPDLIYEFRHSATVASQQQEPTTKTVEEIRSSMQNSNVEPSPLPTGSNTPSDPTPHLSDAVPNPLSNEESSALIVSIPRKRKKQTSSSSSSSTVVVAKTAAAVVSSVEEKRSLARANAQRVVKRCDFWNDQRHVGQVSDIVDMCLEHAREIRQAQQSQAVVVHGAAKLYIRLVDRMDEDCSSLMPAFLYQAYCSGLHGTNFFNKDDRGDKEFIALYSDMATKHNFPPWDGSRPRASRTEYQLYERILHILERIGEPFGGLRTWIIDSTMQHVNGLELVAHFLVERFSKSDLVLPTQIINAANRLEDYQKTLRIEAARKASKRKAQLENPSGSRTKPSTKRRASESAVDLVPKRQKVLPSANLQLPEFPELVSLDSFVSNNTANVEQEGAEADDDDDTQDGWGEELHGRSLEETPRISDVERVYSPSRAARREEELHEQEARYRRKNLERARQFAEQDTPRFIEEISPAATESLQLQVVEHASLQQNVESRADSSNAHSCEESDLTCPTCKSGLGCWVCHSQAGVLNTTCFICRRSVHSSCIAQPYTVGFELCRICHQRVKELPSIAPQL